jgi:hypothetical protein
MAGSDTPFWIVALAFLAFGWPALCAIGWLCARWHGLARKGWFGLSAAAAGYAALVAVDALAKGFLPLPLFFALAFAAPAAATYAVYCYFASSRPGRSRWRAALDLGPVSSRFWLGVVQPTALLALWVAAVIATGQGREWAPATLLIASLAALPAIMLVNCYVLFVDWKSRARMVLAAHAIPGAMVLAALAFVHGTPDVQQWGALALAPLAALPGGALRHPVAALALWALAIAGLLVAARARARAHGAEA